MAPTPVIPQYASANTVEVRVGIGEVARSLRSMRKWLTHSGCSFQVFHCVRDGNEAVVLVEFDRKDSSVRDAFSRTFGCPSHSGVAAPPSTRMTPSIGIPRRDRIFFLHTHLNRRFHG